MYGELYRECAYWCQDVEGSVKRCGILRHGAAVLRETEKKERDFQESGNKGMDWQKEEEKKGEEMGVLNRPVLTVDGYLCHFDQEKNPVT